MLRRITIIALALLLLAAVSGCTPVTGTASAPADVEATATAATDDAAMDEAAADGAGMANPASVFCEENDGKLEIRDEEAGQVGYCVFADGSECEEWSYFRGECAPGGRRLDANMPNPASANCIDQGGVLEIRKGADGG